MGQQTQYVNQNVCVFVGKKISSLQDRISRVLLILPIKTQIASLTPKMNSASNHPNGGSYPPSQRSSTYVTDSKADLVSMEMSEARVSPF